MKQVTRLKTETQLITRKNNERAYAQTLHSILFLSGNIVSGDKSANMMRTWRDSVYQYEDTFLQEDGSIRLEYYTAMVMDDAIHIKISFAYTHTEKSTDKVPVDEKDERWDWGMDEDEVEFEEPKGPQVLGKIDLDKLS